MEAHVNVPNAAVFRAKHPGALTFEKELILLAIITMIEALVSVLFVKPSLYTDQTQFMLVILVLAFFSLVKATLVGGYFMHIFYEKKPFTIFMISFGFPILIILPVAIMVITL